MLKMEVFTEMTMMFVTGLFLLFELKDTRTQ